MNGICLREEVRLHLDENMYIFSFFKYTSVKIYRTKPGSFSDLLPFKNIFKIIDCLLVEASNFINRKIVLYPELFAITWNDIRNDVLYVVAGWVEWSISMNFSGNVLWLLERPFTRMFQSAN